MEKMASTGTTLSVAIATVMTKIGGVRSITGPNPETQFYDATDLESDHIEDGEPTGQSAPGAVSGECFYDPSNATQKAVIAQITAPDTNGKADWEIEYPDDSVTEFEGTTRTWNPKASVGDGLLADFEVKLSEMATFDAPD